MEVLDKMSNILTVIQSWLVRGKKKMNNKNFWDAINDLGAGEFKTYAAIHKLCDNEVGYCFSSNQGLSQRLDKHESIIQRKWNKWTASTLWED